MNKINLFHIRSLLFVPAIKNEYIKKIITLEGINKPDGIIFDLEDSIHDDYKDIARTNLNEIFKDRKLISKLKEKYIICIRINSYESRWFHDDLLLVNRIRPNCLMLAKVSSGKELNEIRKQSNVKQLIVIIETLEGLKDISYIANEMNFYDLLAIGYEDLSMELRIERPINLNTMNPLTYSLMKCLIEAKSKQLLILDGPSRKYIGKKSLKEFEEECIFSKNNGLNCKMAIHPNQIPIINKIFDKKMLLKRAEKLLKQFKSLKDGTRVIVNHHKEVMDTPSYKMYTNLLEYWNK